MKRTILIIAALLLGCGLQARELVCEIDNRTSPFCIGDREPLFSWRLESDAHDVTQKAYRITVLDGSGRKIWDSGRVASDESVSIRYAGPALQSGSDYSWTLQTWYKGEQSCKSGPHRFHTGLFDPADWGDACWIAYEHDRTFEKGPAGKYIHSWTEQDKRMLFSGIRTGDYALPQFRRSFEVGAEPASAVLYITGLGQFEAQVNGVNPTGTFLNPGWTQYDKDVQYLAFDVTQMLKPGGENVISVLLGNGFFNIPNVPYYKITGSFGAPRMRALLKIRYADGSLQQVATDTLWRCCPSALKYSTIYRGESFDASAEQKGWRHAGFDDSAWSPAVLCRDFDPTMTLQRNFPLTVHSVMPATDTTVSGSTVLFDMGQNFSGIFRMKLRGRKGDRVSVRPAEYLLKDGRVCQDGTGSPHIDEYILSGEGDEEWSPKFTYYGQRWFEVSGVRLGDEAANDDGVGGGAGSNGTSADGGNTGADGAGADGALPRLLEFEGLHTCAAAPLAGHFECSNKLYNDIYRLSDWAFRSNLASVLTDCPHREKLGWQEQTFMTYPTYAMMYRLDRIYLKIMRDLHLAQRPDGCFPTIAPEYVRFADGFEDTPEWGTAMIFNPWNHYLRYGDDRPLREYYPAMKTFLTYLESKADSDGVIAYGLGDWLYLDRPSSLGITSHLYYCDALKVMSKIARHLGLIQEAADFDIRFAHAADCFNARFLDPATGIYDNDTQADYACALGVGVVPDSLKAKVYGNLLRTIRRDGAITTGEVAHPFLLRVLSDQGDDDVYSAMHQQRSKPGYGYMIDTGATTLTEAWDGTLSRNHFCHAVIIEWFYERLSGIRQARGSVAYRHLEIAPHPVPDVDWVKCSYDSPYGRIVSNWSRGADGATAFHIEVPPCTDAVLTLPDGSVRRLGSGAYDFRL